MLRPEPPIRRVPPVAAANPCAIVHPTCASCHVRSLCLPPPLDGEGVRKLDALIHLRMRVKRRATLYRPGDRFSALYAIRLGTFKTVVLAEDGREQVTGYHLAGEIIGFDGIGDDRFTREATALEDGEVCVLPYAQLDDLGRSLPELRRHLMRVMSRELVRDQTMMLLLGSRSAEERLALFLLDVAERYHARGYSAHEFVLRMTREEIASHLGLKLETVSRLFSSLQEGGYLHVQGRAVKLIDVARLREVAGQRG